MFFKSSDKLMQSFVFSKRKEKSFKFSKYHFGKTLNQRKPLIMQWSRVILFQGCIFFTFSEITLNDLGGKNKKFIVNNAFFSFVFGIFYPQVNFFSHDFFIFLRGDDISRKYIPVLYKPQVVYKKVNFFTSTQRGSTARGHLS